jgi:hypothetical protein
LLNRSFVRWPIQPRACEVGETERAPTIVETSSKTSGRLYGELLGTSDQPITAPVSVAADTGLGL